MPRKALSTARTLVVPTATRRCAARIRAKASGAMRKLSECSRWPSMRSVWMGWNVPSPTCRVTVAISAPRARHVVQNLRREVKPGGGRRHGTALARENGLVTLAVRGRIGAVDIGRQGHVADLLEFAEQVALGTEAQGSFAEFAPRHDLGFQAVREEDAFPRAHFAAGADQRLPVRAAHGAEQEDFDFAAQVSRVASDSSCRWAASARPCGGRTAGQETRANR